MPLWWGQQGRRARRCGLLGSAVGLCAALACQPAAPSSLEPTIVARIDGEALSKSDFDEALERNVRRTRGGSKQAEPLQLARLKQSVFKQLVQRRLVAHKAAALELSVAGAELDAKMAAHKARFRSAESFDDYLARASSTEALLRRELHDSLLLESVVAAVGGACDVSANEVAAHYASHQDRFFAPQSLKASRLWLAYPPAAGARERRAVLARAERLHQRALRDGDFARLCRLHSDGPEAAHGGSVGAVVPGRVVELDRAIAGGLRPLEVVPPIAMADGVAIYRLDSIREAGVRPLAEVAGAIEQALLLQKRNERRQRVLRDLHSAGRIETFGDVGAGAAPGPSRSAEGRLGPQPSAGPRSGPATSVGSAAPSPGALPAPPQGAAAVAPAER